ncbi:MAG: hypothetical protein V8S95_07795 [Odoribacter sp.]
MNCSSELVEEQEVKSIWRTCQSVIRPYRQKTAGNDSEERMGLVMKEKDVAGLQRIAELQRAPM